MTMKTSENQPENWPINVDLTKYCVSIEREISADFPASFSENHPHISQEVSERRENHIGLTRTAIRARPTTRMEVRMAASTHREIYSHINGPKGADIIARFWSKVDRRGPDDCWDWRSSTNTSGYGRFKIASFENRHANRVAWVIANARDPGDLIIRHTCDRPVCCNPRHLLIGTALDNSHDMLERGRFNKRPQNGVNNGAARLTVAQVGEIVAAFRRREENMTIATRYPVGHALISRIRTGRSWQAEAAQFGWQPAIDFMERRIAA